MEHPVSNSPRPLFSMWILVLVTHSFSDRLQNAGYGIRIHPQPFLQNGFLDLLEDLLQLRGLQVFDCLPQFLDFTVNLLTGFHGGIQVRHFSRQFLFKTF